MVLLWLCMEFAVYCAGVAVLFICQYRWFYGLCGLTSCWAAPNLASRAWSAWRPSSTEHSEIAKT